MQTALIENVAREDLNPVDEARACAALVDELGLSKEELAGRLGRTRPAISNLIRLLDLPDDVLDLLAEGELSEGHGRAILIAKGNDVRRRLARDAVAAGWSVRETERRANAAEATPKARGRPHPDQQAALGRAEEALERALGTGVKVRAARHGVRAELSFESLDELLELAAADSPTASRRGSGREALDPPPARLGRRACSGSGRAGARSGPARTRSGPGPRGSRPSAAGRGISPSGEARLGLVEVLVELGRARPAAATAARPRRRAASRAAGWRSRRRTRRREPLDGTPHAHLAVELAPVDDQRRPRRAASCAPLADSWLVKKRKPASSTPFSSTMRASGLRSASTVARVIASGSRTSRSATSNQERN